MKRAITIALVVIVLVLLALWSLCVYQVNQKYPAEEIHVTEYGTTSKFSEMVSMKVLGREWVSFQDFKKEFEIEELSEEGYYCMVEISLTNEGTEETSIDLSQLYLETEGHLHGVALEIYVTMSKSDTPTLNPTLQPGESLSVILPYTTYSFQWKARDWEQIQERGYMLIRYDYPDKWCWEIE